ncbi:MAG: hypothetical protein ACQKBY_08900 [Verrucomicrobiales bacterium]
MIAVPLSLLAMTTASQAVIVVSESFAGYQAGNLNGQAALGAGLSGSWTGDTDFQHLATGLSLSGMSSSGGSANMNSGGNAAKTISVSFASALSNGPLFGSYLFSTTTHANARTVGALMVGGASDSDGTASFAWAGNGYNSSNSFEGPNIRAEGTASPLPGSSLTGGETYLMLFQFNGATGESSAWVLSQAQLTNFSATLDAATLDSAALGAGANEVTWKASVDGDAADPMTDLILLGLQSTSNGSFSYTWDEFRISDTSLAEAVAIPEPSVAVLGALAAVPFLRRRRK